MTAAQDTVIADRYRLIELIAVGGMGEVWRGTDEVLGRNVAVKILKREYAADATFIERFRAEARHTAALSHPGIANVFDYGETDGVAYLVMELVSGEPLSQVLADRGRLSASVAMDVVGQAALALQAAHDAGVIHRDIKPGNLLLRPDGTVKVTDFGIARARDAAPLTSTGLLVGTAYYVSPEQASGEAVTPASDVYSLGVVAYECLAGARPFTGDNPVQVAMQHQQKSAPSLPDDVPAPAALLVEQALQKDPSKRPASAEVFGRTALALRDALQSAAPDVAPTVAAAATPPTRVFASPPGADPEPAAPDKSAPVFDQQRARRFMLLIGAVVILIGALALCAVGGSNRVLVPNLVGKQYDTVKGALHNFDVRTTFHDDTRPRGVIIAQSLPADTKAAHGSVLTLVLSSHQATVNPDAYTGQPFDQVRKALTEMGLVVRQAFGGTAGKAGTVKSISPTGTLDVGSTVTVTTFSAPAPPKHKGKGGDHGD